ncbi:MAG: nuclear transport factor 2 family protein [Pseudomonadota bacterium]
MPQSTTPEAAMHENLAILSRFDVRDVKGSADVLADDVVWHFFNPQVPALHGDHKGIEALAAFFAALAELTAGSFTVNVVDARPVGEELVVVQTRNTLTLDGRDLATDVVVVWRIVDGKIAEVWDIPSLHTLAAPNPAGPG